jgi:hypothetical protein
MNSGTFTTTRCDDYRIEPRFNPIAAQMEEIRRREQAIAAEDSRRRFVALCVKVKRSTVRIFRAPEVLVKAMPKFITRQHKTKQIKVLQMRFV